MGIGVILFGLEAHPVQQFQRLFLFELGAVVGVDVKDLLNGLADGLPGSRLAAGSWKIICISRRSARSSDGESLPRLMPVS